MLKITDLKPGDFVRVLDAGTETDGMVTNIDRGDGLVCIDNGVQEFWHPLNEIMPIPLSEEQLLRLGFEREQTAEGMKFKKGPFRVLILEPGDYSNVEIWYREDRRHFNHPLYVHELQNHHLDMTKMTLEKGVTN